VKIVLAHSVYRQRGGEEAVFEAERALLERYGHSVRPFTVHNEDMARMGSVRQASATVWNRDAARQFREFLRADRPAIVHFHNTFPLLSPAAIRVASEEGAMVVQTLHNYRLLCANGLFFRDGHVCEDCLGKAIPWPGVVHRCYQASVAASAAVATMLTTHRAAGTWARRVDRFIALTEFARRKFIEGGLSPDRLVVKPNFVPDPGPPAGTRDSFALFVGRLSPEKGISTMLRAWRELPSLPLRIVGTGPLAAVVEREVRDLASNGNVACTGHLSSDEVSALMRRARFLVLPSECYEGAAPRVLLEAFACALPVVAARHGAMAEAVEHARTGVLFRAGDPADLVYQIRTALAANLFAAMGKNARLEFEDKYNAQRNYKLLMKIYRGARSESGM
jgi:glycosyltransferase involved in cell wall biosynthesis